jgi:hypothetical protein
MTDYEHPSSFKKNGFVLIPNVLSGEDVQGIRQKLRSVTRTMPSSKRMLTITDLFNDPELSDALIKVQFSKQLLNVLSEVIGKDFVYVNDFQVQCNMFGLGNGGWHFDAGTEADVLTNRYLYEPTFRFGKVGVYLQDNTAEFGGGISVIPGSHRSFRFVRGSLTGQVGYRSIMNKMRLLAAKSLRSELLVPIKAGSAVYFDSRLWHHSTAPQAVTLNEADKASVRRVSNETMSAEKAKYVFYWEAARKENALHYLENSSKRGIREEVGLCRDRSREICYAEFLSYFYPDDYPRAYVDQLERSKALSITCLDKPTAAIWKMVNAALCDSSVESG